MPGCAVAVVTHVDARQQLVGGLPFKRLPTARHQMDGGRGGGCPAAAAAAEACWLCCPPPLLVVVH